MSYWRQSKSLLAVELIFYEIAKWILFPRTWWILYGRLKDDVTHHLELQTWSIFSSTVKPCKGFVWDSVCNFVDVPWGQTYTLLQCRLQWSGLGLADLQNSEGANVLNVYIIKLWGRVDVDNTFGSEYRSQGVEVMLPLLSSCLS